jgi:Mg2+ and Co2+ transporter CorA
VVLKAYFSNSTAARLKKGHMIGQFGVIRDVHFPYLRDMDESVKWVRSTINAHESAIQEVRENLTVVSDLRVQQVNTTLSLVATIFLPLTFLVRLYAVKLLLLLLLLLLFVFSIQLITPTK